MANCSIPSSTPAIGRILTTSSRRSKSSNKNFYFARLAEVIVDRDQTAIGNRKSKIWRVKGAWWPSRSSKPSSLSNWRDRFDSYPLRQIPRHPERSEAESKEPVAIRLQNSSGFLDSARNDETNEKGGERDVA